MRRHPTRSAVRSLLVVAAVAAALCAGAGPAAAQDGIAVDSHATYVIDGAGGPVHVTATMTLRNTTPSTATRIYYFNAYSMPVPAGATGLTVTSGGQALTPHVADTDDPTTQVAEVSFAPLYYGRTRTLEWSFDIPGAPVRSANKNRVGPGYATFAVQVAGDPGHVSADVVAPAAMKVDTSGTGFQRDARADGVHYVSTTSTDGDGIWAVVSARDPQKADETKVSADGATITLDSFPGDKAWSDFVSGHVTQGLPVLERTVGMTWPGGLDSIREDTAPQALQYEWFDSATKNIVLSEDLDAATLFHEMGHTWFGPSRFDGRWLSEGLTEVVAQRVVAETDGKASPRPAPDRSAAVAIPLTTWTDADQGSFDVEDYAYAASSTAVTQLLSGLDAKGFAAVVSAAYAGESGYEPAGSKQERDVTDWRRFLDLVEGRGGSAAAAEKAYRTWVVSPDEAKQLDARAGARTAYAALDKADGAWLPPLGLREAMTGWRFDTARSAVVALAKAPAEAGAVQSAATAADLPVPTAARQAYEAATTEKQYAAAGALLTRTAAAIPAVGRARDDAADGTDPFSRLGGLVLGVGRTAQQAQTELAAGDPGAASEAATTASSRAGMALWVGVGLVVLALALVAGVVLLSVAGSRRRRTAAAAAGPSVEQDALEQDVVLPPAGDPEVLLGEPDPDEPVPGEDGL